MLCNDSNKEQIVAFCDGRGSTVFANNIIENNKIANRRKRSKTNKLLMMALLQAKNLLTPPFRKLFYSAAVKKQCYDQFFKYPMFYREFIISVQNILFVLESFNIRF